MLPYKSILVITMLILNAEGTALKLDLPFKTYAQNCVMNGQDITYRMHDLKNVGKEVLCKVDFRQTDMPGTDVVDQTEIVEKFLGNMGQDWKEIQEDARYTKHYNITKADALATTDDLGNTIPYNGADKDDVIKFTQWEEEVVDEPIIIEIIR